MISHLLDYGQGILDVVDVEVEEIDTECLRAVFGVQIFRQAKVRLLALHDYS